jgi:imidazolonepropionase-like amidohydrolase
VDQIKLSMTGEEITGTQRAEDTYMSDEEVAAAVTEAHRRGKRVCAYARSAGSVKMCVRDGVGIVYHASFTDDEGLDLLESAKDWIFVAPGINLPVATLYEAADFGFPQEAAEAVGYKRELEIATAGMIEMHRRWTRVLPGGDYGFAWTPQRHLRPRPAAFRRTLRIHAGGGDPRRDRARRRDHAPARRTREGATRFLRGPAARRR